MGEINLLIIDNSKVYSTIFTRAAIDIDLNIKVTAVSNSSDALKLISRKDFDVIVIDVITLDIDISAFFKELTLEIPKALTLVTTQASSVSERICAEAVTKGAFDYMIKPIHESYEVNLDVVKQKLSGIIDKIKKDRNKEIIEPVNEFEKNENNEKNKKNVKNVKINNEIDFQPDIVLIAVSTGGPMALESILSKLDADFPAPILIIQHMPAYFMETLAVHLDKKTKLNVKIAEDREFIKAKTVYIAPGGFHIKLDSKNRIRLDDSPPIHGIRPAADVLFESVAESYKGVGILAIILTGMGSDGEKGLFQLKNKQNCFCLIQSEETCVVYGMPRVVEESGLADKIIDLDQIPDEMTVLLMGNVKDQ